VLPAADAEQMFKKNDWMLVQYDEIHELPQ